MYDGAKKGGENVKEEGSGLVGENFRIERGDQKKLRAGD
jgi:hypothetical protein